MPLSGASRSDLPDFIPVSFGLLAQGREDRELKLGSPAGPVPRLGCRDLHSGEKAEERAGSPPSGDSRWPRLPYKPPMTLKRIFTDVVFMLAVERQAVTAWGKTRFSFSFAQTRNPVLTALG